MTTNDRQPGVETVLRLHMSDRHTQTAFDDMRGWLQSYRSALMPGQQHEGFNYFMLMTQPHVTIKAIERARSFGFEEVRPILSEQDEQRMSLGVETTEQALHEQRYDAIEDLARDFDRVKYQLSDEAYVEIRDILTVITDEIDRLDLEVEPDQIPDFVCSHCETGYYWPHEGSFLGKIEPDVLCQTCYLRELGVLTNDNSPEGK